MNFSPSTIALLVYGAVSIIGGIIGFAKSQSKATIISGSISGVGLIVAGTAAAQNQEWGKIAGMAIAALLVIVFIVFPLFVVAHYFMACLVPPRPERSRE
jgi:uncharacterized membrane protein (UPF0136 family)